LGEFPWIAVTSNLPLYLPYSLLGLLIEMLPLQPPVTWESKAAVSLYHPDGGKTTL